MAGIDDKREQEHKQRVKKLKAKTSKMRLAVIDLNKDYETGVQNEIQNAVGQSAYTGVNGKDRVFKYLSDLRDTGEKDMLGSGAYVKQKFPDLSKSQVKEVTSEWMQHFKSIDKRLKSASISGGY